MFSYKTRRLAVAVTLVAIAGITAASAAAAVRHAQHIVDVAHPAALPVASGDLGEVVVTAPGDLGEIVVRAPHDVGDVLVQVAPVPAPGELLATVVVTAPRASRTLPSGELAGAEILAAVR